MRIISSILLATLLVVGCSHFPPPTKGNTLFPPRTYQHQVDLKIKKTSQNFQFQGVLRLDDEQLRLYMLGPMNVSAVKISENFASGNIKIENQLEQFKDYESKMKSLYFILRSLILYPKDKSSWAALEVKKRRPSTAEEPFGQIELFTGPAHIEIEIKKYLHGAPAVFEIRQTEFMASVTEIPKDKK